MTLTTDRLQTASHQEALQPLEISPRLAAASERGWGGNSVPGWRAGWCATADRGLAGRLIQRPLAPGRAPCPQPLSSQQRGTKLAPSTNSQ
jgi:hypothetical protein